MNTIYLAANTLDGVTGYQSAESFVDSLHHPNDYESTTDFMHPKDFHEALRTLGDWERINCIITEEHAEIFGIIEAEYGINWG